MPKKIWLLTSITYLATRLINLSALPIFNDEAFYIYAARQIAANPVRNLFISFLDGKEPFFFWVYTFPVKFFPDALLGIRLFTAVLGFVTLIFLVRIAKKLTVNPLLVALTFTLSPFLLFYQRIGLQETLLTLLLTAAGYYFLTDRKVLLGIFLGLSVLTKTSSLAVLVFLLPVLLYRRNFLPLVIAGLLSFPVMFGLGSVTGRSNTYFGIIPPSQILDNFKLSFQWLWQYQGPMGLLGLLMPPALLEILAAKIFFPRYFLFVIPAVILFTVKIFQRWPWLLFLFLIPNLYLSLQIIFNLNQAPLPYIERWQYLESWPAGTGIKETADFLAARGARNVVVEPDIMITRYGLAYYYPNADYQVGGSGDYYVFAREQNAPSGMVEVFTYKKPVGREKISVYQRL